MNWNKWNRRRRSAHVWTMADDADTGGGDEAEAEEPQEPQTEEHEEPAQPDAGAGADDLNRKIEELTADLDAKDAVIAELRATIAAMQESAGVPVGDDNPQAESVDDEDVQLDDLFDN